MPSFRATWTAMTLLAAAATASIAQTAPITREPLTVVAAGSLRAAMSELARGFERDTGNPVRLGFGASGLLKDRIEAGEPAQVFASANMNHPEALRASGKAESVRPFARNALCALARSGFSLQGQPLAQRLLDRDVRVGTSTPKADPAGDYAFEMFDRVEAAGAGPAGSAAALKAKALTLTGGPSSPPPPVGRSVYGQLLSDDRADLFITYCTNAAEAKQQWPELQILPIPPAINVSALYGIATLRPASAQATAFVDHVLGPAGQQVLARYGFSAP